MDAPVRELQRLQELLDKAGELIGRGEPESALAVLDEALMLDEKNLKLLAKKAEALETAGRHEAALRLRAEIKTLKREAWQRQVEAELRGQHEVLGEAIRHESL